MADDRIAAAATLMEAAVRGAVLAKAPRRTVAAAAAAVASVLLGHEVSLRPGAGSSSSHSGCGDPLAAPPANKRTRTRKKKRTNTASRQPEDLEMPPARLDDSQVAHEVPLMSGAVPATERTEETFDEFFKKTLDPEDNYCGIDMTVTPELTEITIYVNCPIIQMLGKGNQRIDKITKEFQKRFGFSDDGVKLYLFRAR
eukprot:TRINITY_DN49460_c0_g1_i1.p1 TRINITY_DN49460_c0_g1~~TRINITY_DN49460_c0_g1_i1.p1  ORF type:complete len:199 (-),score=50.27 TRINITY_DN49460_c0_g1_i1:144-740(-)